MRFWSGIAVHFRLKELQQVIKILNTYIFITFKKYYKSKGDLFSPEFDD